LTKPEHWRKTSGCAGGLTSIPENIEDRPETVIHNGGTLSAQQVCQLVDFLFKEQELYRQTGGVHTSLLTDGEQEWISAEDIGRHNTLDKIAGRCLFEQRNFKRRILLTTGRISSEMLQKAARMRTAFVISRTSPSSLSIELADQYGITLVGYARRNRFNVYSHSHRIAPGVIEVGINQNLILKENG
jgi:FdhD protein